VMSVTALDETKSDVCATPKVILSEDQHVELFGAFKQFLRSSCNIIIGASMTISVSAIDEQVFVDCRSFVVDKTPVIFPVLPLDESPYPSNVAADGSYIMGSSECRRYRRDLWRQRLDDLAKHDGYCYLWVFRYKYRKDVAITLGRYPTFWEVLARLTDSNFDVINAKRMRVVSNVTHSGSRAMHLYDGVVPSSLYDHGTFYEVSAATMYDSVLSLRVSFAFSDRGNAVGVQNVAVLGTTVTVVDYDGARSMMSASDDRLCQASGSGVHVSEHHLNVGLGDFDVRSDDCKCEIHKPPLIVDEFGCSVDTSISKSGATVAARGNRYCSATPDVREKDAAFQSAFRDFKVGLSSLETARASVVYLKSANSAIAETFGIGYCYLYFVQPKYRWRVARVIGPNPSLNDVYLMSQLVGSCKDSVVSLMVYNRYHCHFVRTKKIPMEKLDSQMYDTLSKYPGMIVI